MFLLVAQHRFVDIAWNSEGTMLAATTESAIMILDCNNKSDIKVNQKLGKLATEFAKENFKDFKRLKLNLFNQYG